MNHNVNAITWSVFAQSVSLTRNNTVIGAVSDVFVSKYGSVLTGDTSGMSEYL
jgi:hypothetical protein